MGNEETRGRGGRASLTNGRSSINFIYSSAYSIGARSSMTMVPLTQLWNSWPSSRQREPGRHSDKWQ